MSYTIFTVLIFIAAVLLILVVLVQNSKGGGLASNFASSNQVMGVRQTTDFLEKATWGLAIAVIVFSIMASVSVERSSTVQNESILKEQIEAPAQVTPNAPAPSQTITAEPTAQPDVQPTENTEPVTTDAE